jgi:cytochrome c2
MRLSVLLLTLLSTACSNQRVSSGNADSVKGEKDIAVLGCGSCHTIPGVVGAHGRVGPSQPSNMRHWIQHPHAVHPDTVMPELGITDAEAREISTFLYSLK